MQNTFLDCIRSRGSDLFRFVMLCSSSSYSSSSLLFLSFFLSLSPTIGRIVAFVAIVGIQITTIFNTIPELECFRYVYLVVLSCVLKRKSSIFRFVVIGIMHGGFECNKKCHIQIYLSAMMCSHTYVCECARAVAWHTVTMTAAAALLYALCLPVSFPY